jgi:hypothetical protein
MRERPGVDRAFFLGVLSAFVIVTIGIAVIVVIVLIIR